MKLLLENVRSFAGSHEIPLRPLTFLTGENSAGKSSLMAMIASTSAKSGFPIRPDFNREPYNLGGYDTIATYKGGKYGRAKSFSLGYTSDNRGNERRVVATYVSGRGQTSLSSITLNSQEGSLSLKMENSKITGSIKINLPNDEVRELAVNAPYEQSWIESALRPGIFDIVLSSVRRSTKELDQVFRQAVALLRPLSGSEVDAFSVSPIRTRPRRTYDEAAEGFSPEGDHIPYLLAKMYDEAKTDGVQQSNMEAICRFGDESGLFKKLNVRRLGTGASDPFQLMITVAGRAANISDVGYGVSQSLPVIVQSVLSTRSSWMLLQQPEVHLHPRAQAALGTFFCNLVAKGRRTFVIETHSDFIIDRVRQEVAAGRFPAGDVSILYLEKKKFTTTVHPITLDSKGNIIGAPAGYRDFFLREELNLFNADQLSQ
jgi:predicted ATPase